MKYVDRTRGSGPRSSHGLPPLSAFFMARRNVMGLINTALSSSLPGSPAVAVVIGLSGTGKTQISLKYAYDNNERCAISP